MDPTNFGSITDLLTAATGTLRIVELHTVDGKRYSGRVTLGDYPDRDSAVRIFPAWQKLPGEPLYFDELAWHVRLDAVTAARLTDRYGSPPA